MIKRTIIKTPPQELPSSASKELDKSTKYDATLVIVVVLSYS